MRIKGSVEEIQPDCPGKVINILYIKIENYLILFITGYFSMRMSRRFMAFI